MIVEMDEVRSDQAQAVGQYLQVLPKLVPAQMIEQLGAVVQRFVSAKGEADISRWATAVDLTATRGRLRTPGGQSRCARRRGSSATGSSRAHKPEPCDITVAMVISDLPFRPNSGQKSATRRERSIP